MLCDIYFDGSRVVESGENYDPLDEDEGFTISSIEKGKKCFLQEIFLNLEDDKSSVPSYHYPISSDTENKLILHQPIEVWGFDGDQLILAVVTSHYMSPNVCYTWIKDGVELKSGKNYCCIRVNGEGKYNVVVKNGETIETSECIRIMNVTSDCPNEVGSCTDSSSNELSVRHVDYKPNPPNLPRIRKSDFSFSADAEIGRGTFGTVFKGEWAGTPVAI